MSLKTVEKPKADTIVSADSWLSSLAKLAQKMSTPPPSAENRRA